MTDLSVRPEQYGQFLIETFEEWVGRDAGTVLVQKFGTTLAWECLKDRFLKTPDGEPGLKVHAEPYMRIMAHLLWERRTPAEIMEMVRLADMLRGRIRWPRRNSIRPLRETVNRWSVNLNYPLRRLILPFSS